MRLLIDECLGHLLVLTLRQRGHDVVWVRETARTMPDEKVLEWSVREGRVLVTEDFDYGDLIFGKGHAALGVVIIQLDSFEGGWANAIAEVVTRLEELQDGFSGHLTVVGRNRIRSRALIGH